MTCSLSPLRAATSRSSVPSARHSRDRVGGNDRVGTAVERVRERGRVSRPAGELDRLPAQRVAPIPRMLVAKRSRESGEKPDPKLDILLAERGQPFLEQRHEPIVAPARAQTIRPP